MLLVEGVQRFIEADGRDADERVDDAGAVSEMDLCEERKDVVVGASLRSDDVVGTQRFPKGAHLFCIVTASHQFQNDETRKEYFPNRFLPDPFECGWVSAQYVYCHV